MPSAIRPLLGLVLMLSLLGAEVAHAAPERVEVVVVAEPGKKRAAERLVRRIGGDVGQRLPIVHGFTARVPAGSIARLRRAGSVRTVARDVPLTLSTAEPLDAAHTIAPPPAEIPTDVPADVVAHDVIADAAADASAGSSLAPDPVAVGEDAVAAVQDAATDTFAPVVPAADDAPARARASIDLIRASAGARGELTGAGVDVALIDSGVLGVAALDGPGKLVRGPDFSEDAYDPDLRGLDAFGHGSHMAGVIAGDDAETGYKGIAPGAARERQGRRRRRHHEPRARADGARLGAPQPQQRRAADPRPQPLVRRRRAPLVRARAARLRGRAALEPRRHGRRRGGQQRRRHGQPRPAGGGPVPDRRRRNRHAAHR